MDLTKTGLTDDLQQPEPAQVVEKVIQDEAPITGAPEVPITGAPPVAPPPKRSVELDPRALAATKREARAEGRRLEAERLTKLAQDRGFKTVDEMLAAIPGPGKLPDPAAAVVEESKANIPAAKRVKQLEAENALLLKKQGKLSQELKNIQTENALRQHAYESDVKDIDYAVALLKRKITTMAPAELKTFSPADYFSGLRGQYPYIFRAQPSAAPAAEVIEEKPLTTSPTARMPASSVPAAPRPADVSKEAEAVDVMAMKPDEYQSYLRRKGIRDPRLSL